MTDSPKPTPLLPRIPTGIKGFDTLLQGGLLQGGVYLVAGPPGTGKTTLANQVAFHHVAEGGRVAYVTLMVETHTRLLANLRAFAFYKDEPIGSALQYFSGLTPMMQEGLSGLRTMLRGVVRDQRASLLIIDGIMNVATIASSELAFKQFIHEIQAYNEASGCTTLLLAGRRDDAQIAPAETMVDGIFDLANNRINQRTMREIEVVKFRGSSHLEGQHVFVITDQGMIVYPRTEAVLNSRSVMPTISDTKLSIGVPSLDTMLHGGLVDNSMTLLLGPSGSGKTLLGLHFLRAGVPVDEPGLYFGFYETPERLIRKADEVGLQLGTAVDQGQIELLWQPALEDNLDHLAERLLTAVQQRGVRRLFIDGLNGFQQATAHHERLSRYWTALTNELRAQNVTAIFTLELRELIGTTVALPMRSASAMLENLILLRYVEYQAQLHRLLSILKIRDSGYDASLREFKVTPQGIDVASTFASAEAIVSGIARTRGASGRQSRRSFRG